MPRIIEGDPEQPKKIRPQTQLLRPGLDEKKPYFIFEEEIPRAGIKVRQTFQRTRGINGKVYTWMGVRKITGRGEGMSNLAFDQLVNVKQQNSVD
jgi:hypothetical protein